ncbi:MAG: phosphatase PAP2 family protein [Sedimentisphaerales bacterium]
MLSAKPINWHRNYWIKAFRYLGRAWLLIWLLLVWFLSTGRQRPVLITLLALIIVGLTVNPLKVGVRRPRPREVIKAQSGQEEQLDSTRHLSFPSGDTAVAFAVATVVASFVTWPLVCLLLAGSSGIALLRVTAMAHYPSDVFAGAAIGLFASWLAIQIERRYLPLQRPRFNLTRGMAILGIIIIPIAFILPQGIDKFVMFLKTYGLLAIGIFLAIRGHELIVSTTKKLVSSERFDCVLNWLRKRRILALKIAFPIIIAENIIDGEKPYELLTLGEETHVMAVIGFILVFTGAFIRFWARGHFRRGRLITTGPYALLRHPLYLGSLLVIAGVLFQLNDWSFNGAVILPTFALFHGAAIIYEERALSKRFGREWETYRAKVPAVIPSLRNWPLPRPSVKWSWKVYLTTPEVKATLWLLTLPLWIEIIEDVVFEAMLGI